LYVGLNSSGVIEKYSSAGQDLGFFGFSGDAPGTDLAFAPQAQSPSVPEPASLTLFVIGIAGIAGFRRRRKPQPCKAPASITISR